MKKLLLLLPIVITTVMACTKPEPIRRVIQEEPPVLSREEQVAQIFAGLTGKKQQNGLRAESSEQLNESNVFITNFTSGGFLLYGVNQNNSINVYGVSSDGALHANDTISTPMLATVLNASMNLQSTTGLEKDFTYFRPGIDDNDFGNGDFGKLPVPHPDDYGNKTKGKKSGDYRRKAMIFYTHFKQGGEVLPGDWIL